MVRRDPLPNDILQRLPAATRAMEDDPLVLFGGLRAPVSVADAFTVVREAGIVSESLHGALVKMAEFRNVVVHQYDEVDAEIVIAILAKHLGTFDAFRLEILSHLKA